MGKKNRGAGKKQNSGANAGKPGFGRSPWARKPRDVSRQAFLRGPRKKFAFLPFSEAFLEAHRIEQRGLKNVSDREKRRFIWVNRFVAANEIADTSIAARGIKFSAKNAKKVLAEQLNTTTGSLLDTWTKATQKAVIDREMGFVGKKFASSEKTLEESSEKLWQKIHDHALKYFRVRGIPVKTRSERDALNITINRFLAEKKMAEVTAPLNLPWIEQTFLKVKKIYRGLDQDEAIERKRLFMETFGRERLTANQRRAAKKWFEANYPKLLEEQTAASKKLFSGPGGKFSVERADEVLRECERLENEFGERARTELLGLFRGKKKQIVQKPVVVSQRVKLRSRVERMAAYKPREKSEKKEAMRKEERKAKVSGEKFDSVAYALKEIRLESRSTAEFLERLLGKRLLKRDSLIRLFTSGSLTQRLFQTVVNDAEFRSKFDSNNIDRLARGLAFIGPTGKRTAKAKRAFQGEKGKTLFAFLERRGFVDTSHGKGNIVTYLARI